MTRNLQHIPKIIVIVGPTGSGKSAFAIEVAEQFDGEIMCADSRTVYKGMDIGTAKPDLTDRARVPHYLLDVVEPDERFTAADFKQRTNYLIGDIAARRKLPIIVGGTGLYVDSLIFDYQFGAEPDPELRARLEAMTTDELQQLCSDSNIDTPENTQNRRHLIRAIELGGLYRQSKRMRRNTLVVGLDISSEELKPRIEERAYQMLKNGVIDETRLLAERYGWDNEAMKANIYKVFKSVIDGAIPEEQAIQEVIASDMRLVKRQRTWFKRNPYILWGKPSDLKPKIAAFLAKPIS